MFCHVVNVFWSYFWRNWDLRPKKKNVWKEWSAAIRLRTFYKLGSFDGMNCHVNRAFPNVGSTQAAGFVPLQAIHSFTCIHISHSVLTCHPCTTAQRHVRITPVLEGKHTQGITNTKEGGKSFLSFKNLSQLPKMMGRLADWVSERSVRDGEEGSR